MGKQDIKQIREFQKFLKKNNCYEKYFFNLKENKKEKDVFFKTAHVSQFVLCAFTWFITKEGDKYWREINKSWMEYTYKKRWAKISQENMWVG